MNLPGYDEWKTRSPDDEQGCEFCGASHWECRQGWRPEFCTGECGQRWRDPDAEREARRDER